MSFNPINNNNNPYQAQYIMLCNGDEGKQLIQTPYLQIRLYQLHKINTQSIIQQYLTITTTTSNNNNNYITTGMEQQQQHKPRIIHLVTKQRNYYIDMLLQNNQQLIINNNLYQYQQHQHQSQNLYKYKSKQQHTHHNHNKRQQTILNSKITLPLILQLIHPQQQHKLQSYTIPTINHFNILKKISQGSFAEIFLAQYKYNRHLVAIKRINKHQYLTKSSKKQLHNQVQIMKYRHSGKIALYHMFETQLFVYLVMQYCVFGNIYNLIKRQNTIKGKHDICQQCEILTKQQKIQIWLQVAITISHMHSRCYMYRDLKPQNILINHNGVVKLCDFGYSVGFDIIENVDKLNSINKMINTNSIENINTVMNTNKIYEENQYQYKSSNNHINNTINNNHNNNNMNNKNIYKLQKFTQLCGTLQYIPPQLINGLQYDKTIDIYALGILLYQLLQGHSPFSTITFQNMKQLKSQPQLKYNPKTFNTQQTSLINALTCIEPQQRLGYKNTNNIFRHPFFQLEHVSRILFKLTNINRQKDYELLMKLKCEDMDCDVEAKQYSNQQVIGIGGQRWFKQPYNYLTPTINIQYKIGPKFNPA